MSDVTLAPDRAAAARLLVPLAGDGTPAWSAHLAAHGALAQPGHHHHRRWSEHVLDEIARSGLTGRGGAGFPTARKLELLARQHRRPVLVVNAMEGEPASMKDRVLLEHAPHLVLDGAQVAAAVIGAQEIVVCVADDRPLTAHGVARALAERHAGGVDAVAARVELAPGRYAAGEESALVDWVAGGRGVPRFRPHKGTPLTVKRRPVLLQNAETLAHVALVARHGAEWFRSAGTAEAPGTTLVTVAGSVPQPGVVEVELGTTLRAILARAGCTDEPAAVLLGGYGGAWLSGTDVDTAYAPQALAGRGAAVGAGVVGVLPVGACGIAETARIVGYLAGESAGQCGPCVFGLPAMADDLARLATGRVDGRLLERLRSRANAVEGRGACRLPDGAVRLVRSALSVFATDVRAHAKGRPCPGAGHRGVLPVAHRATVPPSPGTAGR
ncbi:MAG: NADH-ubiquinone oxidoreductase-F iron-sulfur binding region domain-containing protein [Acidimicrobiales bacterium]